MLKRARRLLARQSLRNPNEAEIMDVLAALGQGAAEIKRWHLRWLKEKPSGYRVVSTKAFATFRELCKDHIEVFPRAYDFTTGVLERDMRLSTICLLYILQAMIDIHASYPNACAENFMECQETMAKVEAKAAADALCMHVPWSSRVQNATYACTYSIAPLYHASEFYRRYAYVEEQGWCAEVSQALSERYGILVDFSAGLIAQ